MLVRGPPFRLVVPAVRVRSFGQFRRPLLGRYWWSSGRTEFPSITSEGACRIPGITDGGGQAGPAQDATGAVLRVRFARSNPRHTPHPMRHVRMGHQAILDGPLSPSGAGCSPRSTVRSEPCAEYNTPPCRCRQLCSLAQPSWGPAELGSKKARTKYGCKGSGWQ